MKIVFKKWYLERKAVFPFTAEIFVFLEAEIIEIFVKKRKPAGKPGTQEGDADWDEDWDKFEDEGMP
ncbi:unnamed protein product [Prunus armeniaca]